MSYLTRAEWEEIRGKLTGGCSFLYGEEHERAYIFSQDHLYMPNLTMKTGRNTGVFPVWM